MFFISQPYHKINSSNKMNNTKSLMIAMKPKNPIKMDIVELNKSETYPKEEVLPENSLCRYQYQPGKQHADQKR